MPTDRSPLEVIHEALATYLILPEDDLPAVDFIMCVVASQHVPGAAAHHSPGHAVPHIEPVWGYLLGPPSSGKTGMTHVLDDWPTRTYCTSDLSQTALVSGYRDDADPDHDPSLLPKLEGKAFVIQDISPLATSDPREVDKLLGKLRVVFDGKYTKDFGHVGQRGGRIDTSVLICATPKLDELALYNQAMGERLVALRICRPRESLSEAARRAAARAILSPDKIAACEAAKGVVHRELDILFDRLARDPDWQFPSLPDELDQRLSRVATAVVRIRTSAYKHGPAQPESPDRLLHQLEKLAILRSVLSARPPDETDYRFALRIAYDSLPSFLNRLLVELYRTPDYVPQTTLAANLKWSGMDLHDRLVQLVHVDAVEFFAAPNRYRLADDYRDLFREVTFFPPTLYPVLQEAT